MAVPFTQFLRPDGRKTEITIDMPAEVEAMAHQILNAGGWNFEIEELMTGMVSMEICDDDGEITLAVEICPNGPEVPATVEKLIRKAHARWRKIGAISKSRSEEETR